MLIEVLEADLLHSVRAALAEDVGSGDLTAGLIPEQQLASAAIISRESAVLCGMAWCNAVFAELDTRVSIDWLAADGDRLAPGQTLCRLQGPARALLTGERTALNFLQTLSATATQARSYADRVADLPVRILDTRKTIPGLRQAQKYAVRIGGCHNHRIGLYDAMLVKENHIRSAGSIGAAVTRARELHPHAALEVEVEHPQQIDEALAAGVTRLLLDNFSSAGLAAAVARVAGRAELEASGSYNLDNLRETALTGVDCISIGALTKNIQAIDLSMEFDLPPD